MITKKQTSAAKKAVRMEGKTLSALCRNILAAINEEALRELISEVLPSPLEDNNTPTMSALRKACVDHLPLIYFEGETLSPINYKDVVTIGKEKFATVSAAENWGANVGRLFDAIQSGVQQVRCDAVMIKANNVFNVTENRFATAKERKEYAEKLAILAAEKAKKEGK